MKYKLRQELTFLLDDHTTDALVDFASQKMTVVSRDETIHDRYFAPPAMGGRSSKQTARQRQYRIRRIGRSPKVFLESRSLCNGASSLRRTTVPLIEVDLLEARKTPKAWAGKWFHKKITKHNLRPSLSIDFARTALQSQSLEGDIRLTVDRNTTAQQIGDHVGTEISLPSNIVRMKYFVWLPAVCKSLIYQFALLPEKTDVLGEIKRMQTARQLQCRSHATELQTILPQLISEPGPAPGLPHNNTAVSLPARVAFSILKCDSTTPQIQHEVATCLHG